MQGSKEIKKRAMEILYHSYHGLDFIEWCKSVQEDNSWYRSVQIQEIISELIKKESKIEYLEKDNKKIYIHFDLLY